MQPGDFKHVIMPSEKSPQVEKFLKEMTGKDRRATILARECMQCDGDAIEFRDEVSRKEYAISGLCQKCQDEIYGTSEE